MPKCIHQRLTNRRLRVIPRRLGAYRYRRLTAPGRRGRTFASLHDEREWGEGRLCLWLAAPEGMQRGLVEGDPVKYFVPPYVGHRGWVGYRLDLGEVDWEDVAAAVEDAYAFIAERG